MADLYDSSGSVIAIASDREDLSLLEEIRSDRVLIWHDEFNGGEVDTGKWSAVYGQSTTSGGIIYPENIRRNTAVNGMLDYFILKDTPYSGVNYSCPFLHTNHKFEFRYGLVEAKMKFSPEAVFHSTLWTLGANSERICTSETEPFDRSGGMAFPSCGEIDIAECDNGQVSAVTHYSSAMDSTTYLSGTAYPLTAAASEWHIYGCEWTSSQIKFYVDRVLKGTWSISGATLDNGYNPFMLPHFLIFNSVPYLSGTPAWDEMHTLVDWVRVYAPEGVTEKVEETAIALDRTSVEIAVGGKAFLTAAFTPGNTSDMTLIWESLNTGICTCRGGKITGVAQGSTYVKVTSKRGCYALCKVTVTGTA